jgi:hypothetical protein
MVVHGVPDELGDHRRQPAVLLRPPRRDRRAARRNTVGIAGRDHAGRRRGHTPGSRAADRLLVLAHRARLAQCPIVQDPGGVTLPC